MFYKLKPNGTSFEVGHTYKMDSKPKFGEIGFHCFNNFIECYYSSENKEMCSYLVVQLGKEVAEKDGVFCSNEMRVIKEIGPEDSEKTLETFIQKISKTGWLLTKIPKEKRTPEMCLAAVLENPWMLKHVPEDMRPRFEMCLKAVSKNGLTLEFVPDDLKTPEMCLKAVSYSREDSCVLLFVPETMRTPEVCLAAVSQNGMDLQWVPDRMKTLEVCRAAVLNNGYVLDHVPESMITPEMCDRSVSLDPRMLQFVPESMRTHAMCYAAVSKNELLIKWVPDNMIQEFESYFPESHIQSVACAYV
jgi:hypothetical protein